MKKLTLDPNALKVQSFVTDEAGAILLGTVHGRQEQTGAATPTACPSAALPCVTAQGKEGCQSQPETDCTAIPACRAGEQANPTRGANCASAVDACPTGRGCTEVNCPA